MGLGCGAWRVFEVGYPSSLLKELTGAKQPRPCLMEAPLRF